MIFRLSGDFFSVLVERTTAKRSYIIAIFLFVCLSTHMYLPSDLGTFLASFITQSDSW